MYYLDILLKETCQNKMNVHITFFTLLFKNKPELILNCKFYVVVWICLFFKNVTIESKSKAL